MFLTRANAVLPPVLIASLCLGFAGCGGRPTTAGDLTPEEHAQVMENEKIAAEDFYKREKARIEGDASYSAERREQEMSALEQGYRSTRRMLGKEKAQTGQQQ